MNGKTTKFVGFHDSFDYQAGEACISEFLNDRITHNKGLGVMQGIIYTLSKGGHQRSYHVHQTKTLLVVQRLADNDA